MRRYQATPPPAPASFPVDPATNFQSAYPLGFAGCMYCGDSNHVFHRCPSNGTPGASAIFYSNLFAHKPHHFKRAPLPHEFLPQSAPGIPPTQSFVSGPVPPASFASAPVPTPDLATLPPAPPPLAPLPPSALKKARFCLLHVKSFQAHLPAPAPLLPPMPIAMDNGLPHIAFDLGVGNTTFLAVVLFKH